MKLKNVAIKRLPCTFVDVTMSEPRLVLVDLSFKLKRNAVVTSK